MLRGGVSPCCHRRRRALTTTLLRVNSRACPGQVRPSAAPSTSRSNGWSGRERCRPCTGAAGWRRRYVRTPRRSTRRSTRLTPDGRGALRRDARVVQAGHPGQHERDKERPPGDRSSIAPAAASPPRPTADRLGPGLELAEVAGLDHHPALEGREPQPGDEELARHDRCHHPGQGRRRHRSGRSATRARAPCRRSGSSSEPELRPVPPRRASRPSSQSVDIAARNTAVAQ